jgi:hypothetical protein
MSKFLKSDTDKLQQEVDALEKEFKDLLDKVCLKTTNQVLLKQFTQLSYLSKDDQRTELNFPRVVILKHFIKELQAF